MKNNPCCKRPVGIEKNQMLRDLCILRAQLDTAEASSVCKTHLIWGFTNTHGVNIIGPK